jgi:protoporphyrinogen/coproporphyrinogen III oxidase
MQRIAVVGAGISGLSHAYYIKKRFPDRQVVLFNGQKPGGNIATETFEGATLEPGPDSYLDRTGLFNKLALDLGLGDKLIFEDKKSAKRFILKDGYLVSAPKSPGGLITTSLLFFPEKIRMFFAMRRKFSLWPTITLFDAARNVLGFSAAEYLASPFARGVYGSEAEDLEFSSIFPQLFKKITVAPRLKSALKEYMAERKAYWHDALGPTEFNKGIYSFKGGMITWIDSFVAKLTAMGVEIVNEKISRVQRAGAEQMQISSKVRSFEAFDRVVFTIGTADLAYVTRDFDKEISKKMGELKYSPINVVYSAWNRKEFSYSGYGFLVPRKERSAILGSIFASNVFPGRASEDAFLTKTMISGESNLFNDAEMASLAEESLCRIMKVRAKPRWNRVYRHTPGIPRYAPGYGEWKRELLTQMEKYPQLHLAGWAISGIGLADQVESAYMYARSLPE